MTEILMMTPSAQLCKFAKKERITSIVDQRTHLDFQKLVDKIEPADITMKLEVPDNLKLQ